MSNHAMESITETEQEFIERVQAITPTKLPQEYVQYLPKNPLIRHEIAYSPDNKAIGIVFNSLFDCPRLLIFDTSNHKLLRDRELLDFTLCPRLAIARDGHMFASVRLKIDRGNKDPDIDPYSYWLTITNMQLKKTKSYDLYDFDINKKSIIAFNKQGTDVIFCNLESNDYKIFPVTVNKPDNDVEPRKLKKLT